MSKFSINLKKLRSNMGLTQSELANKLGVSKSTVSMYENGNRTPDFEILESIADLFNVTIDFLIGSQNNKEQDFETIAAHKNGDDWTEEELETIEMVKEMLRQKRKKKSE